MDLKQILDKYNIRYAGESSHRHVREGWLGLDCPWCGTVGKYHLGVHLGSLRCSCWRCGRHDLAEALSLAARMPMGRAIKVVKDIPKRSRIVSDSLPRQGRFVKPAGLRPLSRSHKNWLLDRGLDPDKLEHLWGLQGTELSSRLSWRIWAPVILDGEPVSWTARTIGKGPLRWIHARPDEEALSIKSLLYGWDYVRGSVVVVEGPSDVWRVGPGAVAQFGLVPTDSQIHMLRSVPLRVICFDRERVAQQAAQKLVKQLQSFPGETIIVELESDDPGSATDEEVAELRKFLD